MRRRRNPATEQYELLSSDTLKAIVLLGGVAVAGYVALRLYQKAKARDTGQAAGLIRIPIELTTAKKKPAQ